jgi:hypothetical protein
MKSDKFSFGIECKFLFYIENLSPNQRFGFETMQLRMVSTSDIHYAEPSVAVIADALCIEESKPLPHKRELLLRRIHVHFPPFLSPAAEA